MIIGITGTDGGGKGEVVDYLVTKKGYIHCSARSLWIDEIRKRGLEVKRENMRIVANSLRAEHGNDYLVAEYLRQAKEAGWKDVVIESLRAVAEAKMLKSHGGLLLAVDADPHIRYERVQKRASESDRVTLEEFTKQEELEMNDPDPNGMQKAKVMAMADYTLQNNGTLGELHEQIEEILAKIAA